MLMLVAIAVVVAMPALGPVSPAGPETTAAAKKPGCLKIWHQKKVTKWKKKKNGKRRQVTVVKKWWTCDPFEAPGPPRLGVDAKEYKFTLSRPEVKAGSLILEFNNRGEDAHNLRIAYARSNRSIGAVPDTPSRRTSTQTFELKPGLYRFTCTLFGHAARGMRAKLRVLAAGG